MKKEIWKYVPNALGRYSVSNFGRVKSEDFVYWRKHWNDGSIYFMTRPSKILKPEFSSGGYPSVSIFRKRTHVHRLVLMAFDRQPKPKEQCAHLDGSRTNNKLSNLKWVSAKENSSHKYIHGTQQLGENHPCARLTNNKVLKIRSEYLKKNRPTQRQLASKFGVSNRTINFVINRKIWKHI